MKVVPAVVGIDSNLKNGNHFLMVDYDDKLDLGGLVKEINRLQFKFDLNAAHIVESSENHYNVFFFEEDLDYFDALRIIHDTPCCKSFKSARMHYDEMTLRLSPKIDPRTGMSKPKPKLVHIVSSKWEHEITEEQQIIKYFVLRAINTVNFLTV